MAAGAVDTARQATFLVAGVAGILAGLLVIILMRPAGAQAVHLDERPPVPQATQR